MKTTEIKNKDTKKIMLGVVEYMHAEIVENNSHDSLSQEEITSSDDPT